MNISLRRYGSLLLTYLRPQKRRALLLVALLVVGIAVQLTIPQILRWFLDAVGSGQPMGHLTLAAVLFLIAGLINQALTSAATYVGADVGWSATNQLRSDLAEHCLKLDMSFHNDRTPGELIERIDGDVTALANFFSQLVVKIVGAMLLMSGALVLLCIENWKVGAIMALFVIVAVFVLERMKEIAVPSTEREREASAGFYGFIEERLAGLDDIRGNGAGAYVMHRFHAVNERMFRDGRKAWLMRASIWIAIIILFTIGDALSLGLGIGLLRTGAITLGTVYLFYQYTQVMWGVIEQIIQQMQDLQKAGASIVRIQELLAISPSMRDGERTDFPSGPASVELDHVGFAYGAKGVVLDDVTFTLAPGRVLGLLGRTGSGKTTLTRLLFRLYDPTSGGVRVGGIDVRAARLEALRGRVAMVTQEVQLFHATLRDNLTFFDHAISDERIWEVIDELGLRGWYGGMPQGLDTPLRAGGGGLSAGEAQLVAFTRVFLQDPGLVILDEPSSRMDRATEQLLERSMERLLRNRTAIIIAHRLSTVMRADEIMILDKGRIVEHGERARLAADTGSRFHRLLESGHEMETLDSVIDSALAPLPAFGT